MRRLVRFYDNIQPSVEHYKIDDILTKWTDYQFQVRENYLQWLFPLPDDTRFKLTAGLRYKFQKEPRLRRQVIRAVIRFMLFLGYTIKVVDGQPVDIIEVKRVHREENNVVIGLYNKDNFPRITRILTFLSEIKMYELGTWFFLMLCQAMQKYPDLKFLIESSMVLQDWMKTQPYLEDKRYEAEEALIGEELESWEKSNSLSEPEPVINDAW